MKQPTTVKEIKFTECYLIHGNAARAVREAGYHPTTASSASSMGHELLTKLDMQGAFTSAGLTLEIIAQNIARIALTAIKQNQLTDEAVPDYDAQLKAMRLATHLMSAQQAKNHP